MREIIPTVIPKNLEDLRFHMQQVSKIVPIIQIDVVDGRFAPTTTWPYQRGDDAEFDVFVSEEDGFPYWKDLDFEVDMMVQNSPEEIHRWIMVGAKRVIIHVESTDKLDECIAKCEEFDVEVTLALRPSTPSDVLEPYLDRINAVQFMGNDEIGKHGVSLDEKVLEKIRTFHETHPSVILAIDIGVKEETIPALSEAGITRFASGSAIFGTEDIKETVEYFKNL